MDLARLQEMADRNGWESTPLDRCNAGQHVFSEPDDRTGIAICAHCNKGDFVSQPRERAIACVNLCGRTTWNISGICDPCKSVPLGGNP